MSQKISYEEIPLVILVLCIVGFILVVVPSILSQFGCEKYINENNDLKNENQQLKENLQKCESERSSLNKSLDEKDKLIANLTVELNKTKEENENLKKEIDYYEEKKYVPEIHNYFSNISNQLTEIKVHNTYNIIVSIALTVAFTLTLLALEIVVKPFRTLAGKLKNKNNKNQSKTQEKTPTENKLS